MNTKNKVKTEWLAAIIAAVVCGQSSTVQAIPINGTINFEGGTATLNATSVAAATSLTFGGSPTVSTAFGVAPTGSFDGTGGMAVTYVASGFQFAPILDPNPVNPLWTFSLDGLTYSFNLQSVTSSVGVGPSLNLAGTGLLSITGDNSPYDPTEADWSFSTTGSGPSTFGFVAGNATVPDGGTTVLLLGLALAGMGVLGKRIVA